MARPQHQVGTSGDDHSTRGNLIDFIDQHTMIMHTPDEQTFNFGSYDIKPLCDESLKKSFEDLIRCRIRFTQHCGTAYRMTITDKTPCSITDIRSWLSPEVCDYPQACGFMALVKHFGLGDYVNEAENLSLTFEDNAAINLSGRFASSILYEQQEQRNSSGGVEITYNARYL